jgi:hypothetical protein
MYEGFNRRSITAHDLSKIRIKGTDFLSQQTSSKI